MHEALAAAAGIAVLLAACSGPAGRRRRPRRPRGPLAEVARRAAHTMTPVAGDALLVAGGCVVDGCATATATSYVVVADDVERVGDLAEARDAHTATLLDDGRVLVTGGFAGEGRPPLTSAEVFDPATGSGRTWGPSPSAAVAMPRRCWVTAGCWSPAAGSGAGPTPPPPRSSTRPRAASAPGPDLPEALDGLAATSLRDGSVLVAGGQVRPGVASDMAVVVDPDGTMAEVGPLATARFKHALTTLDSGRALVVGGTPDDRRLLTSTEVYDPVTRTFRSGPSLREGRYKLGGSALALPGDRVVVAGGGSGVEVVDVDADRSRRYRASAPGRRRSRRSA